MLKAYPDSVTRVGIDPTGTKFKEFYPDDVILIPEFFSAKVFKNTFPGKKAKIITSISMFYDLENPVEFAKEIESILEDDGIWHFEQSYMPSMLRTNAYDTICHEHLEFYSLNSVDYILRKSNLRIIDVETNAINGGSFAITACKKNAPYIENTPIISWVLYTEKEMGLLTNTPYFEFGRRMARHRTHLLKLVESLVAAGKTVLGYGASTKGNVLLQYCGIGPDLIPYIAEVNSDKFGAFTPGTNIPIISEAEAHALKPDYFLVLPWHFRTGILEREQAFRDRGGKFIFPLPDIEII